MIRRKLFKKVIYKLFYLILIKKESIFAHITIFVGNCLHYDTHFLFTKQDVEIKLKMCISK